MIIQTWRWLVVGNPAWKKLPKKKMHRRKKKRPLSTAPKNQLRGGRTVERHCGNGVVFLYKTAVFTVPAMLLKIKIVEFMWPRNIYQWYLMNFFLVIDFLSPFSKSLTNRRDWHAAEPKKKINSQIASFWKIIKDGCHQVNMVVYNDGNREEKEGEKEKKTTHKVVIIKRRP